MVPPNQVTCSLPNPTGKSSMTATKRQPLELDPNPLNVNPYPSSTLSQTQCRVPVPTGKTGLRSSAAAIKTSGLLAEPSDQAFLRGGGKLDPVPCQATDATTAPAVARDRLW